MHRELKSVAILYNPDVPRAADLSSQITDMLEHRKLAASSCAIQHESKAVACIGSSDLIITLGGDGTLLRTAHFAAVPGIPILGINLGKLGFLCDMGPDNVLDQLPIYLDGKAQLEERLMLQVQHQRHGKTLLTGHALNDVVLGHASIASLVRIHASINGNLLTTFAADGVIAATPSGSTAYSFAAGGPILHPADQHLLLTPISPHKPRFGSVVAPPNAVISLELDSDVPAVLSIDGEAEIQIESGDTLEMRESPYKTRLLRRDSERYFFKALRATLKYGLEP